MCYDDIFTIKCSRMFFIDLNTTRYVEVLLIVYRVNLAVFLRHRFIDIRATINDSNLRKGLKLLLELSFKTLEVVWNKWSLEIMTHFRSVLYVYFLPLNSGFCGINLVRIVSKSSIEQRIVVNSISSIHKYYLKLDFFTLMERKQCHVHFSWQSNV